MCFLWKKLKGYYKNLKIQQKLTFSHLIIVLISNAGHRSVFLHKSV